MVLEELPSSPSWSLALSLRITVRAIVLRYVKGRAVSGKEVSLLCSSFCLSPSSTVLELGSSSSVVRFLHHFSSLLQKVLILLQSRARGVQGAALTGGWGGHRVREFKNAALSVY